MALNGGMQMEYTHAISFKIDCADQAEVDRLWDTLSANGGKAEQCGWLRTVTACPGRSCRPR